MSGFVNYKGCTFKRHFNFYITYRVAGYVILIKILIKEIVIL